MLTKDQRELRKTGLGGSDAAAIAGFSKYKSPVDVALVKLGLKEDDEFPTDTQELRNDPRHWGNIQEPVIAAQYEYFEGKKVEIEPNLLRHPKYTWMIANIDRRIVGENAILECKTANEYKLKEWGYDEYSDEMPDQYLFQCIHYAIVDDANYVDCAVLIGGNKFRVYRYNRDKETEQLLIELEHDFWHNHILKGILPAMNKYAEACKAFKKSNGTSKTLPAELIDHVKSINFINSKIKEYQEQLDFDKAKICEFLGESEILLSPLGMQLASWKEQATDRLDVKRLKKEKPEIAAQYINTTTTRVLRVKEFK